MKIEGRVFTEVREIYYSKTKQIMALEFPRTVPARPTGKSNVEVVSTVEK
jgi:hypothetical protein